MRTLKAIFVSSAAWLCICSATVRAQTSLSWISDTTSGTTLFTSSGNVFDGSFRALLGGFSAPVASNDFGNLASSFQNFATPAVSWNPNAGGPGLGGIFLEYTSVTSLGSVSAGQQAYIWFFNSQNPDPGSEWLILTNTNWTFPSIPTLPSPGPSWSLVDVGTQVFVGSVVEGGFQATAIPEPSTYSAIMAVGALGLAVYRRKFRRKAAVADETSA